MQTITFRQCVEGAWRDAWRYVHDQRSFVTAIFVIAWFAPFVENALLPDTLPPFRFMTWVPVGVFELLKIALTSILVVQATRHVLLGNRTAAADPLDSRIYCRYLGYSYGLAVLVLAMMALTIALVLGFAFMATLLAPLTPHNNQLLILLPIVVGIGSLVGMGVVGFVWTRLSLLATHVAIGGALQVRATWADTRGHCWSIGLTQAVSVLPMVAVSCAVVTCRTSANHHGLAGLCAFGEAVAEVAALCVGAACSAWLYRRYAGALGAQPGLTAGALAA
jgi:hypothetical protein